VPTTTPSGNTVVQAPAAGVNTEGKVGVVSAGTSIGLSSGQRVCTNTNSVGDRITATTADAVTGSNGVVIPAGATAVLEVTSLGRSSQAGENMNIGLVVRSIAYGGKTYPVNGEIVSAAKVVIGIGISDFAKLPEHLSRIPEEYLSHSSRHAAMDRFKGQEVAVIGGGSSATDIAALMHEAGASAQLVTRRPELAFHSFTDPATRTIRDRLRNPGTGIGQGWRSVFYTQLPLLFRHLPEEKRLRIIATSQAIAGGWPMRERIVGKVPVIAGFAPHAAEIRDGRIHLRLASPDGAEKTLSADHAILCTGYRVDLGKVKFLGGALREAIATVGNAPALSMQFESSVPGLYFVGPAAAPTFGPMFRFVYGAEFAAPRLAAHLARAALESVAYQTLDLTDAMTRDGASRAATIRVDGGMAANDWFCQFLADVLDARVERPTELETTALGAAFLAGLATGVWPDLKSVAKTWATGASFSPSMAAGRPPSGSKRSALIDTTPSWF